MTLAIDISLTQIYKFHSKNPNYFPFRRDPNDVDVRAVYHQLVDTYVASDSDDENRAGTSTGGVTPAGSSR